DLSDPAKLDQAILSYNNSRDYVNSVLGYMRQYQDGGVAEVPNPPAGNYPTSPVTAPPPTPRPPAPQPPATKPPATKPPAEPEKPKPPAPRLAKLELVGDPELKAEAGAAFTADAEFKAVLTDGKPAVGQKVVFVVEADTTGGTLFQDTKKADVVVLTDGQGIARVPRLTAGPKAGTFSFRASAYDANQFTVTLKGTVTAKPVLADLLVRADGGTKPLEAVAGTSVKGFGLLATSEGQPVAGTKATAGLGVKDKDGVWVPVDPAKAAGPYFKGGDGKKLFTLDLAPSDADGNITLPELFTTDVAPGTYFLRVVTPEKVELILELKITAPATPTPTPPPTPTPTSTAAKP
ncbi:lytic transglycosylase domain-containing protein, partial [Streptomyces sp. NPDC054838]